MRSHDIVAPERTRSWQATAIIASAAAITAAGGVAGCSVLYELKTEQCSSNADCVALGGVFAELECIESLCQEPSGCKTNGECIDAPGNAGEPSVCINRACVRLRTPECPMILPVSNELYIANLRSEDPLIFGGFAPATAGLLSQTTRNYELALKEFTEKGVGPPSSTGSRKLVMIVCDSANQMNAQPTDNDESIDRAMAHLVDDLKVPGVLATMDAEDLQRAFETKGKAASTFFMSTQESDPTLATLQDDGLIWHVGPGADVIAQAYAPLLTRTIAYLKSTGAVGPTEEVKVATIVGSDNRFLSNMVETIQSPPDKFGISFNGLSVADNRAAENYLSVASTTPAAMQLSALRAFRPHVIIAATYPSFLSDVMPLLESSWDESDGQPKPFYLLSPFHYNRLDAALGVPGFKARLAGVNGPAAEDQTLYEEYVGNWDTTFIEAAGVRGYENYYDAAYYLIYSAIAAGTLGVSSGSDLKLGMQRLLNGNEYYMCPRGMVDASQALARGAIKLMGTLGPPDFDAISGTRSAPGSVWCVNSMNQTKSDVLRYVPDADPTLASLRGDFDCFTGF